MSSHVNNNATVSHNTEPRKLCATGATVHFHLLVPFIRQNNPPRSIVFRLITYDEWKQKVGLNYSSARQLRVSRHASKYSTNIFHGNFCSGKEIKFNLTDQTFRRNFRPEHSSNFYPFFPTRTNKTQFCVNTCCPATNLPVFSNPPSGIAFVFSAAVA